ncbi:glycosyltransferase family 4 protein [Bacillus sp. UNC41MFS5]|uniref:glycosyltransferase family 4 protein n=1 Tax=Bacillus sp. UNC41MFS5 TaxID=1449046 RepID=UPI00047EBC49|nr:glycosyltransferase family 4 protein [Bacillus sp. UNC41MFS5]
MKILFVVNGISGGASNVIQLLATHFQRKGNQVDLLLFDGMDVSSRYDLSGVKIIELPKLLPERSFNSYTRVVHRIKSVKAYLKKDKPDIIVSFLDNINTLTCFAAWNSDIPIIVSERTNTITNKLSFPWDVLRKIAYRRANKVIVQCSIFADFYNGYFKNKTNVIPNPIVNPKARHVVKSDQQFHLVSAGRLAYGKNFEWLINTFAKIVKRVPEAHLTIYGRGEKERDLKQMIGTLGLESSVTLAGYTTNVHEKMAQADVYVMPSLQEGFPNSLCEAMAVGLPVVAFQCHEGLNEIVTNGENGFLVEMNNQEAFIEKVVQLSQDRDLREQIGTEAQKLAERYSEQNIYELWEENIQNVMRVRESS